MLTKIQIQDAYLNSGLDSYPNSTWLKLNEHERWKEIEELIKYLHLINTEFPAIALPPELEDLRRVWQAQADAFDKLCQALQLYPLKTGRPSEKQTLFSNREATAKENARQAAEILVSYIKNFGDFDANRIQYWPAADFIMNRYSYDLIELNEWLNWYGQLPKAKKPVIREVESTGILDGALMA